MATFAWLFVFVVLGVIARAHGFRVVKLLKYLKEELLIVLGTSTSEAALPSLMVKLEKLAAAGGRNRGRSPRRSSARRI